MCPALCTAQSTTVLSLSPWLLIRLLSALRQICYQPRVLLALSHVGETDEMRVQDASAFAACREELSYWELMVCDSCPRASCTGSSHMVLTILS